MKLQTLQDIVPLLPTATTYPIYLLDYDYQIQVMPEDFFHVPQDYFVEIAKDSDNAQYKLSTQFNRTEFYTFIPYHHDDISIIVVGPILYHTPYYNSEIYDNDFLNSLNIYPRTIDTLLKIPHASNRFFAFLRLFYQMIYDKPLSTQDIFASFREPRFEVQDNEILYNLKHFEREYNSRPYPHHLEKQLLHYISRGENTRSQTTANDILKTKKLEITNVEPLHCYKYTFSQMMALFRTAIIHAGVDTESAFSLGNLYIEKMDKCVNEQVLHKIYMNAITDFCTLVKTKRFHNYPVWMRTCMDYMLAHLHSSITLQELSELVHLTPTYLSVQFKKLSGYSIIEYMNRQKVEEAKFLLEQSHKSLLEISTSLGFNTQSYFTSVFKKYVNCTPIEYRNHLDNDQH